MFFQIRFQTGEIPDVIKEMKNGNIPCMDVDDNREYQWVIDQLQKSGIYRVDSLSHDVAARDRLQEPEFEFRDAFCFKPLDDASEVDKSELMFIDFYFEPTMDDTYDSIGEI